ncbi:MAG: ribonuclease III [Terrestrivirus sp.]|uniref:Ribonuclease III n=1 Tax=Terrestrivirus sp. TaxID=2487775 RepID=A0A3G4ZP56_9VIRU|nr:MAG: ribonuclease III [Terrestrivirus sp.]
MDQDYDDTIDYPLYILNEKNKFITKQFINSLLARYDIEYTVNNLSFFQRAMTHTSYLKKDFSLIKMARDKHIDLGGKDKYLENTIKDLLKVVKLVKEKQIEPISDSTLAIPLRDQSYERMEFLGDSIIHSFLAEYLYDRYPDKDEGFLTKLRTKIENGTTLARLARTLGLHEYVLIARNIEQVGGRDNNDHIFEDTFESFLGALFDDSKRDYDLCKKLVINIVEQHIDLADMIYNETNYKDLLLQFHHKMKWPDPEYGLVEIIEKNSKKYFNMYVKGLGNNVSGHGTGSSKKRGEQIAAQNALKKYGVLNDDESDEEEIYEEYD